MARDEFLRRLIIEVRALAAGARGAMDASRDRPGEPIYAQDSETGKFVVIAWLVPRSNQ